MDFEIKLRDYLLAFAENKVRPKGYELDFSVASAYGDVAGEQILDDAIFMPVGFSLVCIYVVLMLGHLTCVENRVGTVLNMKDLTYKESSRTQILNVNRPSNHPSTTKTRPQVKQARLPTKTAVVLGPSY